MYILKSEAQSEALANSSRTKTEPLFVYIFVNGITPAVRGP